VENAAVRGAVWRTVSSVLRYSMPSVFQGLDVLRRDGARPIRGKKFGVVCNQASIAKDGVHILDALIAMAPEANFSIQAAFGPQHGIWGHTQDNMIEWEGY